MQSPEDLLKFFKEYLDHLSDQLYTKKPAEMKTIVAHLRKWLLKKLEKPRKGYEQRVYNDLEKLYNIIRPGDVVLVEGRSEMSRIIKLFSGSYWSHAAMYVGHALIDPGYEGKDVYVTQQGLKAEHMLIEAYSGKGVIATPLSKYIDYNLRICRPYEILESDLKIVIQNVISRLGMHYDDQNIIDIALIGLGSIFGTKSKHTTKACLGNCNDYQVICSGMIAQAFQSVGYPIVPALQPQTEQIAHSPTNPYGGGLIMRHYTQILPKDFDLSPNFEIIKFNIIGTSGFDYKSFWIKKI